MKTLPGYADFIPTTDTAQAPYRFAASLKQQFRLLFDPTNGIVSFARQFPNLFSAMVLEQNFLFPASIYKTGWEQLYKKGSDILLINEPPEETPEAQSCFWWRRGRVELPVQREALQIYYKLSRSFGLARPASFGRV